MEENSHNNDTCAICLDILDKEDIQTIRFGCTHTYHSICIMSHFAHNNNSTDCPLCRREVFPTNVKIRHIDNNINTGYTCMHIIMNCLYYFTRLLHIIYDVWPMMLFFIIFGLCYDILIINPNSRLVIQTKESYSINNFTNTTKESNSINNFINTTKSLLIDLCPSWKHIEKVASSRCNTIETSKCTKIDLLLSVIVSNTANIVSLLYNILYTTLKMIDIFFTLPFDLELMNCTINYN